jgi:hypothetical protein
MNSPFRKSRSLQSLFFPLVGGLFLFLCLLVFGVFFYHPLPATTEFQHITDDVSGELARLYAELESGELATVVLPESDADRLGYMGPYCDHEDLARILPDTSDSELNRLEEIANERTGPVFIWVRDGKLISVNTIDKNIGITGVARSWDLSHSTTIRVRMKRWQAMGETFSELEVLR